MIYIPKKDFEGPEEEPEFKLARVYPYNPTNDKKSHQFSFLEGWFEEENQTMASCADIYKHFKDVVRFNEIGLITQIRSDLERIIYTDTEIYISNLDKNFAIVDKSSIIHNKTNLEISDTVLIDSKDYQEEEISAHEELTEFLQALLCTKDSIKEIVDVFSKIGGVRTEEVLFGSWERGLNNAGFFTDDGNIHICLSVNRVYGGYAYEVLK